LTLVVLVCAHLVVLEQSILVQSILVLCDPVVQTWRWANHLVVDVEEVVHLQFANCDQ
jgi:hypothetical protein